MYKVKRENKTNSPRIYFIIDVKLYDQFTLPIISELLPILNIVSSPVIQFKIIANNKNYIDNNKKLFVSFFI